MALLALQYLIEAADGDPVKLARLVEEEEAGEGGGAAGISSAGLS